MDIIWMLIVGGIAGWLAGVMMKGRGFGVLGNIVVGIIGAVVGSYLFKVLGIAIGAGLIGSIVQALAGAVVLLALVGLIKRA